MHHIYDDFQEIERFDFTGARIVYQGVEGAYSQQAMFQFFGRDCDAFHVSTFKEAVEAIHEGRADYAVLPMENSSAGIVSENFDLMAAYDSCIIAEQRLPIAHCLLGIEGATRESIKVVYSHPQAISQCAEYLKTAGYDSAGYINTAAAAKKIMAEGRTDHAAIAGKIVAELYGLQILDENIQDNKTNTTRFIILSKEKQYQTDRKKISLCFELPDESGALYKILSHFYFNDLNMFNIQSRPIPDRDWQYRFFIDFKGNLKSENVRKALRRLEEDTINLRILGTYR